MRIMVRVYFEDSMNPQHTPMRINLSMNGSVSDSQNFLFVISDVAQLHRHVLASTSVSSDECVYVMSFVPQFCLLSEWLCLWEIGNTCVKRLRFDVFVTEVWDLSDENVNNNSSEGFTGLCRPAPVIHTNICHHLQPNTSLEQILFCCYMVKK